MQEVIGKVRLNLDYYSGRDLYDEGASEDEILEIVKNVAPCDYNRIIMRERAGRYFTICQISVEILFHFFLLRRMMMCLK